MVHLIILSTLSIITASFSGYFNIKQNIRLRLLFKFVASLLFLAVGFFASLQSGTDKRYFLFIFSALMCGLLGDLFLVVKGFFEDGNRIMFEVFGMASFLLGHILYIVLFITTAGAFNFAVLAIALSAPLTICLLQKFKVFDLGKLFLPATVYCTILALMTATAVNFFIQINSTPALLAMIAGILFFVSDFSLALRNYNKKITKTGVSVLVYVVLLTYYTAQVLFGLSIL
ncbi:MAG: lysoplasmalogenase [Firmicutes bacterium]|nr:lysoplasmalogenase [Bacillota bacterium]